MDSIGPRCPNVLLIGAPRCASTSLADALARHPDIHVCSPKEPHFLAMNGFESDINGPGREAFAKEGRITRDRWLDLFRNRPERYLMDASVSTISYPRTAIENIQQYCDADIRLIAILRDPVERAFSSYQYCLSKGWRAGTFEECLDEETSRIQQNWQHLWFLKSLSQYDLRLQPFLEAFGPDRLHVVISEELSSNPGPVVNGIFEFLHLPPIRIDASRRLNSSGVPRSRFVSHLSTFVRSRPALRRAVASFVPVTVRERLRRLGLERTTMAPATRVRLAGELAQVQPWVENLLGRRIEAWD